MTVWALAAAVYGTILAGAAVTAPIARRHVAAAACAAYVLAALAVGSLPRTWGVELVVPAVFLLVGYWLSGLFFRAPQRWLEAALVEWDRRLFHVVGADRWLRRSPMWVLEALEAGYTADYLVVGAGALVAATVGVEAISDYWSLVLTAELACYVALPWLRSRPPRSLEVPGVVAERAPAMRRVNVAILDRASVQANTLPSGHVAGALAASLAVIPLNPWMGGVLLAAAALIAVAAVAGRYHYAVDCVAGASVAIVAASLL